MTAKQSTLIHIKILKENKDKTITSTLDDSSDQYLFLMPNGRSFLPMSVAGFMQANSLKSACREIGRTSLKTSMNNATISCKIKIN